MEGLGTRGRAGPLSKEVPLLVPALLWHFPTSDRQVLWADLLHAVKKKKGGGGRGGNVTAYSVSYTHPTHLHIYILSYTHPTHLHIYILSYTHPTHLHIYILGSSNHAASSCSHHSRKGCRMSAAQTSASLKQ